MNKRLKKKRVKVSIKFRDTLLGTYRIKFKNHGLATRQRPTLKACPICGKTRRAGFFKSCGGCAWVFEYREALDGLLERIEERLRVQGAGLDRFYHGASVNVRVFLRCDCSVADAAEPEGEKRQTMEFSTGRLFSLYDLRQASFTQENFMREILNLYEAVRKQAALGVDENGRAITLHGLILPVQGTWKTH
jgi:hypothetical protein